MDKRFLAGKAASIGALVAAAMVGGAAFAAVAQAAPIVIKISHDVAADQAKGVAFEKFKQVAQRTLGDKVKIEIYPSGQLYPSDPKNVEALQVGAIHMVAPTFEKWTPAMPRFALFTLPYVFVNQKMMKEALDSPEIGGKLWPDLDKKGLKYLAVWSNGYRQIFNRKREVREPEDLKGLKIRVQAKDVFTPLFRLAGANAQVLAWTESPQAVQQGIVDGFEVPFNAARSVRAWELLKYVTAADYVYSGYLVGTNKSWWDGLPADVQKGLQQSMDEVMAWQWGYNLKDETDSRQLLIRNGMKVYDLTNEQRVRWAQFFRPVHKDYVEVVGKDLLDKLYALQDRYLKQQ
jgi:C4-dicarboxylate-binding protein DctP